MAFLENDRYFQFREGAFVHPTLFPTSNLLSHAAPPHLEIYHGTYKFNTYWDKSKVI